MKIDGTRSGKETDSVRKAMHNSQKRTLGSDIEYEICMEHRSTVSEEQFVIFREYGKGRDVDMVKNGVH